MDLKELMKHRFLFLFKLYEKDKEKPSYTVSINVLKTEIQIQTDDAERIADFLAEKELIIFIPKLNNVEITSLGKSEIEKSIEYPEKATDYFLPLNLIDIGSVINEISNKGANDLINPSLFYSRQQQEIQKIINGLRRVESNLVLTVELKAELICEIKTLEAQLNSPKPKKIILSISLKTIKSILGTVEKNTLPAWMLSKIDELIMYG